MDAIFEPGEYAIVELLGHTTLVGRVSEVERFGTKMLAIEPLFRGVLLPVTFQGGGSIYRFTPCPASVAYERCPTHTWDLPVSIRVLIPALTLPSSSDADEGEDVT